MAAFNPTKWPKGFEGGLYENATFLGQKDTFPNGCHICEVEVDPETGDVTVDRYAVVDDVGTVMNPIGLKGQIHGGVAQGIGQILSEQVVWDRESGQLLTASFLDYAMPRAQMIPSMEVKSNPVPTQYNPLGAKGAGEAGTVGAMPVVMNAIMDALAPLGVKDVLMPATAQNVWRAIQEAKGRMIVRAVLLALLLIATTLPAWAAESVLTLTPRPGVTLRVLVDRPAAPVGSIVLMAGGDGVLDLDAQGNIGSGLRENHLVRTRAAYVKAGYAVFVPDIASDQRGTRGYRFTADYASDVAAVIAEARKVAPRSPSSAPAAARCRWWRCSPSSRPCGPMRR